MTELDKIKEIADQMPDSPEKQKALQAYANLKTFEVVANINDFGRNSFVTHTTGLVERIKKMTKYKYEIEKHITTEWIVTAQREGAKLREPIARCNTQGIALTIKGLYEDYDKKLEEKDNG